MVDTPVTREALAIHAAEVEVLDNQVGHYETAGRSEAGRKHRSDLFKRAGNRLPQGKWSVYDYGTKRLLVR